MRIGSPEFEYQCCENPELTFQAERVILITGLSVESFIVSFIDFW